VPAKIFGPITAKDEADGFVRPESAGVQVPPLFVERNTPVSVPANRFVPMTARDVIVLSVKPQFRAAQLAPLFVETYTPLIYVPA
jgi:hypothetical protein